MLFNRLFTLISAQINGSCLLRSGVTCSTVNIPRYSGYNLRDLRRRTAITQVTPPPPPPVNTKHLYNIYTMLDQRRRRWADVV